MSPTFYAKDQPIWFQFRWQISNLFVWIARWIYPKNPDVEAFYLECIYDSLFYGRTVIRVNPFDPVDGEGE